MRTLELLAPAKNIACGMAAIDHGADAVYIGASRFGARAAAGNSVEDIARLCAYAHRFGVKVYVTLNTLVYDAELSATMQLMNELKDAGVDALLVQDMGIASHAPMPVHASTQCDARTPEKVAWLQQCGFRRVVLARELSLDEIRAVHEAVPDVELEVFVHGALCVSYSGVCYASQYCFKRSANRGECAQFCRMKFDLIDAEQREIIHQRHLLSLKDLCRIDALEELADAGACSFKIEGRLKDVAYVKNVVAAYSQRLDELVAKRPQHYVRASRGRVTYHFTPDLEKTFHRGYTDYFLYGRKRGDVNFDTPKAMGTYVGRVKEIRGNSFTVAGVEAFGNGDGLCFVNENKELEGFRVNRVVGNRLYPQRMPQQLKQGIALYRNTDSAFERILAGITAERRLPITMVFGCTGDGFYLSVGDCRVEVPFAHQEARNLQTENIKAQLSRLGTTEYVCEEVVMKDEADTFFVPSSILGQMRRALIEKMANQGVSLTQSVVAGIAHQHPAVSAWQREYKQYSYLYNISNAWAQQWYAAAGLTHQEPAFELKPHEKGLVMQCRYCLRYALGYCVRRGGTVPQWKEPLSLRLSDGRTFGLRFLCDKCQMNIYAEHEK